MNQEQIGIFISTMRKEKGMTQETLQDGDVKLDVNMSEDTVWLNRQQMAELFDRDVKTIAKHINNALSEELDESTVAKFATVQIEGNRSITRDIEYLGLHSTAQLQVC